MLLSHTGPTTRVAMSPEDSKRRLNSFVAGRQCPVLGELRIDAPQNGFRQRDGETSSPARQPPVSSLCDVHLHTFHELRNIASSDGKIGSSR